MNHMKSFLLTLILLSGLMNESKAVQDLPINALDYRDLTWVTTDKPGPIAMSADILIARPLLLAATAMGTGLFVISLPFSLCGNHMNDAIEQLIVVPVKATFSRCLGCSVSNT